jgi:transposase
MIITEKQYERIAPYFPKQRGNVVVENLNFVNAMLYIIENGSKWRALPSKFGKWHTIYVKFNRWSKSGVLERIFEALQNENIIDIRTEIVCIDSTSIKVHPDAAGAEKRNGPQAIGRSKGGSQPRFIWLPRLPNLR